jgi:hypothetical protein
VRDANLLAVSLAELDGRDWDLNSYLLTKKDLPDSIVMCLVAANRMRQAPRPTVSDTFRAGSRTRFVAQIQSEALEWPAESGASILRRITRRILGPVLVPLAAALLAVGGAAAWDGSSSARPGSTLYPLKVATEQLQLVAALTPSEQLGVRVRIAADRLVEADAEARSGHTSAAQALLHQFDDEFGAARAVLLGEGPQIGGEPLVARLNQQLSVLASERDRVAGYNAPPAASGSLAATSPSDSTLDLAAAVPASDGDVGAVAVTKSSAAQSNSSSASSTSPTVVAAVSSTQVPSGSADLSDNLARSVELVRVIESEAIAGDAVSSYATAHDYATIVRSIQITSRSVMATLQQEHASLVACEADAPALTDGAVQLAANAVADALTISQSSQPRSVVSASVAPANVPVPAPAKPQSATGVASVVQVLLTPTAATPVSRVQVTSNSPVPVASVPPPARVVSGPSVPVVPKAPSAGGKPAAPVPVVGVPVIPVPVIPAPVVVGPILQAPATIVSPKPIVVQGGLTGTTIPVVALAPSRVVARPPARITVTLLTNAVANVR